MDPVQLLQELFKLFHEGVTTCDTDCFLGPLQLQMRRDLLINVVRDGLVKCKHGGVGANTLNISRNKTEALGYVG